MTDPQQHDRTATDGSPAFRLAAKHTPAVDGELDATASAGSALGALRVLLRSVHLAGPDDLPTLVTSAGAELGAGSATLYLADREQVLLVPLLASVAPTGGPVATAGSPLSVDGTLAGRAFQEVRQHTVEGVGEGLAQGSERPAVLWTPVINGTERLGVVQLVFGGQVQVDEELAGAARDVASLLAEMVVTRSLYGDAIARARRRQPMTLPAELQWTQLPPQTLVSPRAAVAGVLAPAHKVAGDSFDYAVNGDTLHVAIVDAMGHGLEAALLSVVAIGALRNARRSGLPLADTVRAMDVAVAEQFGPDRFVTGIVGELELATGWWRWSTCGHPPALLVRGGRVVKTLDSVVGAPLGLELLAEHPQIGEERLQPGDRLLLYTDGVIEARDAAGEFFGTDRLVEFTTRQAADGRPVAETLRRLNAAVLAHQAGALQDDATTVLIEWLTDEPTRSSP